MPTVFDFAWLIPLLPLLAFVAMSLFGHRSRALNQQLIVISCVLALMVFLSAVIAAGEGRLPVETTLINRWLSLGNRDLPLGIYIDPASAVVLSALSLICLMVFICGKETMREDSSSSHFFAIVSLLTASMFGLLVFNNLLLFFIFWEIMDGCAYLLIGLRHEKKSAFEAGLKTFLVTRVGGLLLLLGLALLYATTGSLAYSDVFSPEKLDVLAHTGFLGTPFPLAAVIALLFFGGVVSKSAQFPLHVWLPEANQAPTPASALIHTTMTSAGAFLLIRAFPLFDAAAESLLIPNLGMTIVTLIGTLTAIFAALVAVAQRDIRHALSFSVIGQMGYIVAALGMGAYMAGVFHLITSIFFNALLVLAAGSVVRGMASGHQDELGDEGFNPNDMLNMGGLRKRQPVTFWTFLIGAMALSGLPFVTAGFWSKDAILAQAWAGNQAVFWLLALAASITGFGAARQVCLVFAGPPRSQAAARAPESIPAMTTPLIILAIFAVALGWAGIPEQFPAIGGNWLTRFLGAQDAAPAFVWDPTSLGIAFSMSGLTLGFLVYAWKPVQAGEADRLESAMRRLWLGWLYKWVRDRFYIDRLYRLAFAEGSIWLATTFDGFDRALDSLADGAARLGLGLAQIGAWFDTRVLDALVHWISRASERLSLASDMLDLRLDRLADLTMAGTLALSGLSDTVDRKVLDGAVDGVGRAVQVAGLWFRPRTGKAQSYLLWASVAILMLTAIFLFLFPQI